MASGGARRAALGFSPHIGWAAVVVVSGTAEAPAVVAKRRLDLATTFDTGAVYHVSQGRPLAEAEAFVRSSEDAFAAAARRWLAALAEELRALGLEPVAGGMPAPARRALPPLESILRSHPLVHAAEGELYRRVLAEACEACAIPVARLPPAGLAARVADASGLSAARVATLLAEIGKASGKPWAKDQKDATLAAWAALGTEGRGARAAPRR